MTDSLYCEVSHSLPIMGLSREHPLGGGWTGAGEARALEPFVFDLRSCFHLSLNAYKCYHCAYVSGGMKNCKTLKSTDLLGAYTVAG